MGDGDGWVLCPDGHRHWGRYGAAGLMLTSPTGVVLQHRAPWTHEGGTWALPGGARDSHEDPVQTALRETVEEADIDPRSVRPLGWSVAVHGPWSYTTVVARAVGTVEPYAANQESSQVRWWERSDVDSLPLHAAFAQAWPGLRDVPPPLTIVVDAANVVGTRPSERRAQPPWWRDRAAAARRLHGDVLGLARRGIAGDALAGLHAGGLSRLLPTFVLVVEGAARDAEIPPAGPDWWTRQVEVVRAAGSGDDAVRDAAGSAEGQVVVVTADRGLQSRFSTATTIAAPSWLDGLLDPS